MSDDDDEVGYGRPPKQHRFQPKVSGNPRGRPRKLERAISPSQLRRDIIAIAEKPVTIRTSRKEVTVTSQEAVLMRLEQKALAGHGPSMWRYLLLVRQAVTEHREAYPSNFDFLEMVEKEAIERPGAWRDPKELRRFISHLRGRTRRTGPK